jgi:alcohol dehydrogenase YqhD (iron-dependent ADH family)
MEYGPELLKDPENYDLRSRIMWAATNALNGMTIFGRKSGDWAVHGLGHVLSYLYDTPHGATLSIVYPAWLRRMKPVISERISKLGFQLFGNPDPDVTIQELENYFRLIQCPVRLSEIDPEKKDESEIVRIMDHNRVSGTHVRLSPSDRKAIAELMA